MSDYTPKIETLIKNAVEPNKKRDRDLGKMIGQSQCYVLIALFSCSKKQIIFLQAVNKMFYKRVAQWHSSVLIFPKIRLSEIVSKYFDPNDYGDDGEGSGEEGYDAGSGEDDGEASNEVHTATCPCCAKKDRPVTFEYPTRDMIEQWRGVIYPVVGFENNEQDGTGPHFNFILGNGQRSVQRDEDCDYFDHMIPAGRLNRIRSVRINFSNVILGFKFFDKEKKLLWKIGEWNNEDSEVATVQIAENEVIIGMVGGLHHQSTYLDFQFQIAQRNT